MNTDKPGYLTTEFWTNVFVQLVNLLATVIVLKDKDFDKSTLEPLIPVASMLAAAAAQAWYAHSRGVVKAEKARQEGELRLMQASHANNLAYQANSLRVQESAQPMALEEAKPYVHSVIQSHGSYGEDYLVMSDGDVRRVRTTHAPERRAE